MYLKTLKLYHFRNLEDQQLVFSPTVNLIAGNNGQGKTNIVEAISLLSTSRSFRTTNTSHLVRWGESSASVFGKVVENNGELELGLLIEDGERTAYLNGDKMPSLGEYLGRLPSVSFSPDDIELVRGGPQGRRRFVDRHLVDLNPALMKPLLAYQRALKNKNALLRSRDHDRNALRTWNEVLAEAALPVIKARRWFISLLGTAASELYSRFARDDGGLHLSLKESIAAEEVTKESVMALLDRSIEREIAFHSSLVGPHRDDLKISLGEHEARAFASQGQSRSIVLALKLAVIELVEAERKESPIVLLDDVDAELDQHRSSAFFSMVLSAERQFFVTGTGFQQHVFEGRSGVEMLRISGGKVENETIRQRAANDAN